MYITKPPLLIWSMVSSSKILGFSELSIRLPNAIAGCIVCFMLFFFCAGVMNSSLVGFLSVLILISSTGFIRMHVIRSGEYDAFLLLFVFTYSLSFFMILQNKDPNRKVWYWLVFTIAVICAILTKGVAGILAIPGLFIYVLAQQKLLDLLKSKDIYLSMFFILLFGLGYYFLREHLNPGYLNAVNNNELGGRYINTNEGHRGGWLYYWNTINEEFLFIMPLVFIGIFRAFFKSSRSIMELVIVFCTYIVVTFVFVISISASKLSWYDAPTSPLIALTAGFGFYTVVEFLMKIDSNIPSRIRSILLTFFFTVIIGSSYSKVISNNLSMDEFPWEKESYSVLHYIKASESKGINMNGYKIIYDPQVGYSQICQIRKLQDKGQKLQIVQISELRDGDIVVSRNADIRNQIGYHFSHVLLDSDDNIELWKLAEINRIAPPK